jgi:NTE family protein
VPGSGGLAFVEISLCIAQSSGMKTLTDDGFVRAGAQRPFADGSASILPLSRKKPSKRKLSLALQGGGSFGTFSWGFLDRLLEEDDLVFDAVSGASAGAINAIVLASGLAAGGRVEAKNRLRRFWQRASEAAPAANTALAVNATARVLSPYQFNPFNLNPLRKILAEEIDFDFLRAKPSLRLLIATTRVSDGKLRIFREREVSAEVILASACLPLIHHAVSIDGEAYWDGGYSANPPVLPLVLASRASDVVIVQIMPTAGAEMPTTSSQIVKRAEQITFNASLLRDLESLSAMTKLTAAENAGSRMSRKLQKLRVHHVAAETDVPSLGELSALNLDWDFLTGLRDAGRSAAERWLREAADNTSG